MTNDPVTAVSPLTGHVLGLAGFQVIEAPRRRGTGYQISFVCVRYSTFSRQISLAKIPRLGRKVPIAITSVTFAHHGALCLYFVTLHQINNTVTVHSAAGRCHTPLW